MQMCALTHCCLFSMLTFQHDVCFRFCHCSAFFKEKDKVRSNKTLKKIKNHLLKINPILKQWQNKNLIRFHSSFKYKDRIFYLIHICIFQKVLHFRDNFFQVHANYLWIFLCLLRCAFCEKHFEHISHRNGFSPLCTRICIFKFVLTKVEYSLHTSHS